MWLVPPHMAHIFGFCGTWRGPGRCQNFGKSFQIVARANLAAPPVCPLFQITFFLQDFSRFAIVFAARGCFIFVPSYFQLLQSTSTSSAHFSHQISTGFLPICCCICGQGSFYICHIILIGFCRALKLLLRTFSPEFLLIFCWICDQESSYICHNIFSAYSNTAQNLHCFRTQGSKNITIVFSTFTCPEEVFSQTLNWPWRKTADPDSRKVCKVESVRMGHTAISECYCKYLLKDAVSGTTSVPHPSPPAMVPAMP